jgi:hypothetical protein
MSAEIVQLTQVERVAKQPTRCQFTSGFARSNSVHSLSHLFLTLPEVIWPMHPLRARSFISDFARNKVLK